MTRWARANNAHKAQPSDATPWQELKKKKPLDGIKKFKPSNESTIKKKKKLKKNIKTQMTVEDKQSQKKEKVNNPESADTENNLNIQKPEVHTKQDDVHIKKKRTKRKGKDQNNPSGKNSQNEKILAFNKTQRKTVFELRKHLIKKGESEDKIKKAIFREKSKMKRSLKRIAKTCFKCRKNGHVVSDCPLKNNSEGFGICFRCGSSEHILKDCKKNKEPGKDDLPYAVCFVCGKKGHLSSQCAKNSSGIFPKGGSCHNCGSVNHLKKDCPDLKQEKNTEVTVLRLDDANIEAEVGDDDYEQQKRQPFKKKRIVKFN